MASEGIYAMARSVHPAIIVAFAIACYTLFSVTQYNTLATPLGLDTIRQMGSVVAASSIACFALGFFFEERYSEARMADFIFGSFALLVGLLAVLDSYFPSGGEFLFFIGCIIMLGLLVVVLALPPLIARLS